MERWQILFTEWWTYDWVQGTSTTFVFWKNRMLCTATTCWNKILLKQLARTVRTKYCFGLATFFFFPPVMTTQILTCLSTDWQYKSGKGKGIRTNKLMGAWGAGGKKVHAKDLPWFEQVSTLVTSSILNSLEWKQGTDTDDVLSFSLALVLAPFSVSRGRSALWTVQILTGVNNSSMLKYIKDWASNVTCFLCKRKIFLNSVQSSLSQNAIVVVAFT